MLFAGGRGWANTDGDVAAVLGDESGRGVGDGLEAGLDAAWACELRVLPLSVLSQPTSTPARTSAVVATLKVARCGVSVVPSQPAVEVGAV
jgi:hypothetical protein